MTPTLPPSALADSPPLPLPPDESLPPQAAVVRRRTLAALSEAIRMLLLRAIRENLRVRAAVTDVTALRPALP
jgi:hypothetical protein